MIANRFSISAQTYDRHSRPQQMLIEELSRALPEKAPARILELGCGTGQLTRRLTARYPNTPIEALDISSGMINHCRSEFASHPEISWTIADAQTYEPETVCPLIASSSALHWTGDLEKTFLRIHQNLEPGGVFALGMMLEGTLRELRRIRAQTAPGKVFGTLLPSFGKTKTLLEKTGFCIQKAECFDQRYCYPNADSFLRAIHEQGVTGGSLEQGYVPLTRREIKEILFGYQQTYATGGEVYASYETAVFIAVKD
jgi:malonyl-CoA O-methyltransferase